MTRGKRPIVVGVVAGQPSAVLAQAAVFARRFDAELICASVDLSHYTVDTKSDGTVIGMPIDSDMVESKIEVFDSQLQQSIADVLDSTQVRWSVRALAGGAAQELARLAEAVNAAMIVVGTRERGLKGSLHEFFNGSVAVQLAHRQHRPVVVIPLSPVEGESNLSWRQTEDGA